jgi:hypothetical protein
MNNLEIALYKNRCMYVYMYEMTNVQRVLNDEIRA